MANRAYLSKTKITILDHTWQIFFQDDPQYKAIAPDESRAYCNVKHKKIFFNCFHVFGKKDGVVAHELTHAYIAELMGHDLGLSREQFEEMTCTLMEERAAEILSQSRPLTKQLMQHAKRLKRRMAPNTPEEDSDDQ